MSSDVGTQTDVYRLSGEGIEISYRRGDGKLDISGGGDDHLLNQTDPETGLHVSATLLESSRNGTKVMLTLLVPELREGPRRVRTQEVTGVAVITSSFRNLVDGPPPVLQSHGDVRRLEGIALPAD